MKGGCLRRIREGPRRLWSGKDETDCKVKAEPKIRSQMGLVQHTLCLPCIGVLTTAGKPLRYEDARSPTVVELAYCVCVVLTSKAVALPVTVHFALSS
jgi:hypothetical protein